MVWEGWLFWWLYVKKGEPLELGGNVYFVTFCFVGVAV